MALYEHMQPNWLIGHLNLYNMAHIMRHGTCERVAKSTYKCIYTSGVLTAATEFWQLEQERPILKR